MASTVDRSPVRLETERLLLTMPPPADAAEALRAVIAFAFDELGLHRIQANYIPANERSGRLLERLGFVVEGRAMDYLFIDGAWREHVLTSLTNPNPPAPPEAPISSLDNISR